MHILNAIVGSAGTLGTLCARHREAHLVALESGFAMVPVTESLLRAISRASLLKGWSGNVPGFTCLNGSLVALLLELSKTGPVAYMETEYFGGAGKQAAAAYRLGAEVYLEGASDGRPINHALRAIG